MSLPRHINLSPNAKLMNPATEKARSNSSPDSQLPAFRLFATQNNTAQSPREEANARVESIRDSHYFDGIELEERSNNAHDYEQISAGTQGQELLENDPHIPVSTHHNEQPLSGRYIRQHVSSHNAAGFKLKASKSADTRAAIINCLNGKDKEIIQQKQALVLMVNYLTVGLRSRYSGNSQDKNSIFFNQEGDTSRYLNEDGTILELKNYKLQITAEGVKNYINEHISKIKDFPEIEQVLLVMCTQRHSSWSRVSSYTSSAAKLLAELKLGKVPQMPSTAAIANSLGLISGGIPGGSRDVNQDQIRIMLELSNKNFSGMNLKGVNFSNWDLRTGIFAHARSLDISDANFGGADLSFTNLAGVNLSGANLAKSDLSNANLRGADLRHANLELVNLSAVRVNEQTKFGLLLNHELSTIQNALLIIRQLAQNKNKACEELSTKLYRQLYTHVANCIQHNPDMAVRYSRMVAILLHDANSSIITELHELGIMLLKAYLAAPVINEIYVLHSGLLLTDGDISKYEGDFQQESANLFGAGENNDPDHELILISPLDAKIAIVVSAGHYKKFVINSSGDYETGNKLEDFTLYNMSQLEQELGETPTDYARRQTQNMMPARPPLFDLARYFPDYDLAVRSYSSARGLQKLLSNAALSNLAPEFCKAFTQSTYQVYYGLSPSFVSDRLLQNDKLLIKSFANLLKQPDYIAGVGVAAEAGLEISEKFFQDICQTYMLASSELGNQAIVLLLLAGVFARLSSARFFGTEGASPQPLRNISAALLKKAKEINPKIISEHLFATWMRNLTSDGTAMVNTCSEILSREIFNSCTKVCANHQFEQVIPRAWQAPLRVELRNVYHPTFP